MALKQEIAGAVEGHRLLFRFLFRDGYALLAEVARSFDNPGKPDAATTEFTFSRETLDGYNLRFEALKLKLRKLVPVRGHFGSHYAAPLLLIRVLTIVAAAIYGAVGAFLVSVTQFAVAPYSFFACVAAWLGMVPYYVIHFALFAALQTGTWLIYSRVPVAEHYLRIPITPWFIAGWFAVDQLVCLALCFWSPLGRPVRVSPGRLLQSVTYGFLNSKTYWLVLLLALRGTRIDLLAILIAALVPFRYKAKAAAILNPILPGRRLHFTFTGAMFYHYHRMVHLPGPYNEAHRHHHFLPDATPFDAHMHGTGMPEEWLKLMTEIFVCSLTGLMPWSFELSSLLQSLGNKIGHGRIEGEHPIGDNFHVNHHARHFKNFGFANLPLDLLLGTECGDVSRTDNDPRRPTRCTRRVDQDHYVLIYVPAVAETAHATTP